MSFNELYSFDTINELFDNCLENRKQNALSDDREFLLTAISEKYAVRNSVVESASANSNIWLAKKDLILCQKKVNGERITQLFSPLEDTVLTIDSHIKIQEMTIEHKNALEQTSYVFKEKTIADKVKCNPRPYQIGQS